MYTHSKIFWAQYAFFLSLIGLFLGGGIVFSLSYAMNTIEATPPRIVRRVQSQSPETDDATLSPPPIAQSPSVLRKKAALDTLILLRPLIGVVFGSGLFYVYGTITRRR
jgi:ABC-type antimicrobial peptide transport system permease subunit